MGIKYNREYNDIIAELAEAIGGVSTVYEWLEMEAADWEALDEAERGECVRTMADDLFYGLGADPVMRLGGATLAYDKGSHLIKIAYADNVVRAIRLV